MVIFIRNLKQLPVFRANCRFSSNNAFLSAFSHIISSWLQVFVNKSTKASPLKQSHCDTITILRESFEGHEYAIVSLFLSQQIGYSNLLLHTKKGQSMLSFLSSSSYSRKMIHVIIGLDDIADAISTRIANFCTFIITLPFLVKIT